MPTAYKWDWTVVPRTQANWNYTAAAVAWVPASAVVPLANYYLKLRIANTADGSACGVCVAELANLGGFPEIYADIKQPALSPGSLNNTWIADLTPGISDWTIPFSTAASSIVSVTVTTGRILSPRLEFGGIESLIVVIPVSWLPLSSSISLQTAASPLMDPTFSASISVQVNDLAGVAPLWIAVAGSTAGTVLLASSDELATFKTLSASFPSSVKAGVDVCNSQASGTPRISNAAVVGGTLLMHTQGGIIAANATLARAASASSPSATELWSNILSSCISRMSVPTQQPPANASLWSPIVFIGSGTDAGRAWWLRAEGFAVAELLDSRNNSLKAALFPSASVAVLDAAAPSTGPRAVFFLVQSGAAYYLAKYTVDTRAWSLVFCFPTAVPAFTENTGLTPFQRIWNITLDVTDAFSGLLTLGSTQSVTLTRIAFHAGVSPSLFVYGNALFYSPNLGDTMFYARGFGVNTVTAISSTPSGAFAIETSDNQLWLGKAGSSRLIPLARARAAGSGSLTYVPFFDSNGRLFELSLSYSAVSGGSATVSRGQVAYADIVGFSEMANSLACPISGASFRYSPTPHKLRSLRVPVRAVENKTIPAIDESIVALPTIPQAIFLDKWESFSFDVVLKASASLSAVKLNTRSSSSSFVQVETKRHIDVETNTVTYSVFVVDLGLAGTQMTGTPYLPTAISMTLVGSSLGCALDSETGSNTVSIAVYAGCPLHKELVFSDQSHSAWVCYDELNTVPCILFDEQYIPKLAIRDQLLGVDMPLMNNYLARIVGGGKSLDAIAMYSDDEIAAINPISGADVNSLVWMADNSATHNGRAILSPSTGLRWACHRKSPCSDILPTPQSPSFYFVLEVAADPEVFSYTLPVRETYCNLTARMVVRLYNISPSLVASSMAIFGTTAICILALIVGILVERYVEWRTFGRVGPSDDDFGMFSSTVRPSYTSPSKRPSSKGGMNAGAYLGGGGVVFNGSAAVGSYTYGAGAGSAGQGSAAFSDGTYRGATGVGANDGADSAAVGDGYAGDGGMGGSHGGLSSGMPGYTPSIIRHRTTDDIPEEEEEDDDQDPFGRPVYGLDGARRTTRRRSQEQPVITEDDEGSDGNGRGDGLRGNGRLGGAIAEGRLVEQHDIFDDDDDDEDDVRAVGGGIDDQIAAELDIDTDEEAVGGNAMGSMSSMSKLRLRSTKRSNKGRE
ncbi:hypothetical protein HK105_201031 [Polyrhizophydium stewartii]|uniref:Transmembrane protein n=1 Tax=Polyrhizophydium stewartii TaxID=2732419 RepID=A0ABR4NIM2_9FUNG